MIHQIVHFLSFFASGSWPSINLWYQFQKDVSFSSMIYCGDECIVSQLGFDCGVFVHIKRPIKVKLINRKCGKIFYILLKHRASPKQRSTQLFFRSRWLFKLHHSLNSDPVANDCPPLSTKQRKTDLYPLFFKLRLIDSYRERFRASSSLFEGKITHEAVTTIEELRDCWNPGAMDGVLPFGMKFCCF